MLFGTSYWPGLVEWLTETMLDAGAIAARDRGSLLVTDDPVVAIEQSWACHLTLSAMLGPEPHYPESLAAGMEAYHGYG